MQQKEQQITTRHARPGDGLTIYRFVCELENRSFDFDQFLITYRKNICADNTIYLVALDSGNAIIGYISCHGQLLLHHGGMVYEIQELFVDRHYRSRGAASHLLHSLHRELEKRDCLSLEVTANNIRKGIAEFYFKCGFTLTHTKFTKII